jgi:hypothetical protein
VKCRRSHINHRWWSTGEQFVFDPAPACKRVHSVRSPYPAQHVRRHLTRSSEARASTRGRAAGCCIGAVDRLEGRGRTETGTLISSPFLHDYRVFDYVPTRSLFHMPYTAVMTAVALWCKGIQVKTRLRKFDESRETVITILVAIVSSLLPVQRNYGNVPLDCNWEIPEGGFNFRGLWWLLQSRR